MQHKSFKKKKALHGHMRIHRNRDHIGMTRPRSADSSQSMHNANRSRPSKRLRMTSRVVNFDSTFPTKDDVEVVEILIMMLEGYPCRTTLSLSLLKPTPSEIKKVEGEMFNGLHNKGLVDVVVAALTKIVAKEVGVVEVTKVKWRCSSF